MNTRFLALLILAAATPVAQAAQILVGTTTSNPGLYNVGSQSRLSNTAGVISATFDNQSIAQGFMLNSAAVASDVALWIGFFNAPATFTLRLTDKIGPGTTAADVLASASGSFNATASLVTVSLGNLALGAGSYFLVLTSDTPAPTPALNGANCSVPPTGSTFPCFNTGAWGYSPTATNVSTIGSLTGSYVAHNFTSNTAGASPALTSFNPGFPIGTPTYFQLNGTALPVPEPSAWALFAVGAAAIWGFRRGEVVSPVRLAARRT